MADTDLRSIISNIIQNDDKNAIIFTFDITSKASFEKYLKKALTAFIMEREVLTESQRTRRLIPFMILGMKKDLLSKSKVT